jgi:MFS family permease
MLTSTLVTTAAATAGSLISGWLSDRLGRRKLFVITSALVYALGLGFIGTADRFDAFLVGIALCGLGQGVYLAVDLALVTDVLPNKELDAAKDLGIFNLASALPQSIAPAIAPIFLAIGAGANNYVALFIAAAVFAFLGALAILPVKGVR